jgi:hypothetical protein
VELVNTNSATSKIEVFDVIGNRVQEYTINFVAGGIVLDVHKLRRGLYFIVLTDPTSGFIQKGKMLKVSQ